MSEIEPPARETEPVLCCCVLIDKRDDDRRIVCNLETTGPDDPFCSECDTRHANHPGIVMELLEVTARMREKASS